MTNETAKTEMPSSTKMREALLTAAMLLRNGGPVRLEELVRGAARALNLAMEFPSSGPIEVYRPAQPIIAELRELRQLGYVSEYIDIRSDNVVDLTSMGRAKAGYILRDMDVIDSSYRVRIGKLDRPLDPLPPGPNPQISIGIMRHEVRMEAQPVRPQRTAGLQAAHPPRDDVPGYPKRQPTSETRPEDIRRPEETMSLRPSRNYSVPSVS